MNAARLKKLLLMLSSDQPGEVTAAAQAIDRALKADGSDWHDLASRLTTNPNPDHAGRRDEHPTGDWHVLREFCLDHEHQLRSREREFVSSLGDWDGELTERQHAWLVSIYQRLRGAR